MIQCEPLRDGNKPVFILFMFKTLFGGLLQLQLFLSGQILYIIMLAFFGKLFLDEYVSLCFCACLKLTTYKDNENI